MSKFSIKSIDKIAQVCYTEIKLENKTNILTNNKHKQRKTKMEFIPYKQESEYDSAEKAKKINVKLGHAALFGKNASF